MILLDTNVVSEVMRPQPSARVLGWLDMQPIETVYLSSVTQAELLFGVAMLPDGRRKDGYARMVAMQLAVYRGRILPFDEAAAPHFARMAAAASAAGKPLPALDGYIAAIAAAHGMTVATRDVGPFVAAGVDVINPWQA